MSLRPRLNFDTRGLSGHAATEQFGTLMQLIHIALTEARVDEQMATHILNQHRANLKQLREHPAWEGNRKVQKYLLENDPALRTMTTAELDAVTTSQMLRSYQDMLAGSQQYRLAIVGKIDKQQARTWVEKTIANLPVQEFSGKPRAYPYPKQDVEFSYTGNGSRDAGISLRWVLPREQFFGWKYDEMQMLMQWVEKELKQEIRENQSLVYVLNAGFSNAYRDSPAWLMRVDFNCDVDKRADVIAAIKTHLGKLAKQKVTQSQIDTLVTAAKDERKQRYSLIANQAYWLVANELYTGAGEPHVMDVDKRYQGITPERLQALLQRFVNDYQAYAEVVSLP